MLRRDVAGLRGQMGHPLEVRLEPDLERDRQIVLLNGRLEVPAHPDAVPAALDLRKLHARITDALDSRQAKGGVRRVAEPDLEARVQFDELRLVAADRWARRLGRRAAAQDADERAERRGGEVAWHEILQLERRVTDGANAGEMLH